MKIKTLNKMKVNQKNAIVLWEKNFGKSNDAEDFSGRKILKSSFGQVGSDYGWNIDHILPQSKGGKNIEDNLICVHILTNAEKADKFPVFEANEQSFEIKNQNNGWKIFKVNSKKNQNKSKAIKVWNLIYGQNVNEVIDPFGRKIFKNAYNNKNTGSWNIDKYIEKKDNEENLFIAHTESIEERKGKTSFKVNGKDWKLIRTDGKHSFEKVDYNNVTNKPANFIKFLRTKKNADPIFLDYIFVKFDSINIYKFNEIKNALNFLVYNSISLKYNLEISFYKNYIAFKFETPSKKNIEDVLDCSILLNTYKELLKAEFEIKNLTIINFVFETDRSFANLSLNNFRYLPINFAEKLNNIIDDPCYTNEDLFINGNVAFNISDSSLREKNCTNPGELYKYNIIFSELKKKIDTILKK